MPPRRLPDHTRRVRHSTIVTLLWLHAVVLTLGGLIDAESRTSVLIAGGGLALAAGAAGWERLPMRVRVAACALGLVGSSALLAQLWPGVPAQFHLFVMLAVLALYQDPLAFVPAVAYVLVEHGLAGAGFVVAAGAVHVVAWRTNETQLLRDPLTGLPSRLVLRSRLAVALERLQRRHGQVVVVLLVDLDGFKAVNDRRGHAVGDELILSVADRLRRTVRRHDTVARLGGDAFAILCDDVADPAYAGDIARRVLGAFGRPFALSNGEISAAASIGVAYAGDHGDDGDALVAAAETAMRAVKGAGGGRFALERGGAAVEDVREPGVDDVALEREAELLHDAARAGVVRQRVGDDRAQLEHLEGDA
jgi:diguanylate cyclase (GGDEF)-like protein